VVEHLHLPETQMVISDTMHRFQVVQRSASSKEMPKQVLLLVICTILNPRMSIHTERRNDWPDSKITRIRDRNDRNNARNRPELELSEAGWKRDFDQRDRNKDRRNSRKSL